MNQVVITYRNIVDIVVIVFLWLLFQGLPCWDITWYGAENSYVIGVVISRHRWCLCQSQCLDLCQCQKQWQWVTVI